MDSRDLSALAEEFLPEWLAADLALAPTPRTFFQRLAHQLQEVVGARDQWKATAISRGEEALRMAGLRDASAMEVERLTQEMDQETKRLKELVAQYHRELEYLCRRVLAFRLVASALMQQPLAWEQLSAEVRHQANLLFGDDPEPGGRDAEYPAEALAAAARGLPPEEARPRSGTHFLHERDSWETEVAALRARVAELEASERSGV